MASDVDVSGTMMIAAFLSVVRTQGRFIDFVRTLPGTPALARIHNVHEREART